MDEQGPRDGGTDEADEAESAAGAEHAEATALERELCRLPEISAARVVRDASGRTVEVHVLATTGKHAKQIVRDVQSVALASFGLELDRRIVSVVQLGTNGDAGAPDPGRDRVTPRPALAGISAETTEVRALVRVTLSLGDEETVGFAEGSVAASSRHRLVATATIDALRQLHASAERVDVDAAQIVRVGVHDVAAVTLVYVTAAGEQVVSGSAVVRRSQEADAIARAVLASTNRRLPAI